MQLQSQLYTQAEDVVVPQVKPKELCYWTELRVFSPHTEVCKPNPSESRNWSGCAAFRKSKITELYQISYSETAKLRICVKYHIRLQGFVLDTKIPGNKSMEQHQWLLCCPGTDRTNSALFSLARQEHQGFLMQTCTKLWRKAPPQPKPALSVAGNHVGRIRWTGYRRELGTRAGSESGSHWQQRH